MPHVTLALLLWCLAARCREAPPSMANSTRSAAHEKRPVPKDRWVQHNGGASQNSGLSTGDEPCTFVRLSHVYLFVQKMKEIVK